MCGIAGLFDLRGRREPDRDLLARMTACLRHRGPDDDGLFAQPGLGLGHRRLAIIDLEGGRQPLFNEDGTVAVVCNGEIYNYPALMAELEGLGHFFRSRSDTEVIVHAWEAWGEGCLERFQGMFAFAVWDRAAGSLFLARDRLGIKPLYHAILPDGWLAFGSELKSLLCADGFDRTLDPRAVESYFAFGYVPDPQTIFQGGRKLEPGHCLTVAHGREVPEPRRYWDIVFGGGAVRPEAALAEELIERLRAAVESHLIADVPVGSFLSGGIDSSAVTALMAQHTQGPVHACTIAFDEAAFDESGAAARVAGLFALDHHVETASVNHFDLIDTLAGHFDEPFADDSALPTWLVCAAARKWMKVVLSGDGGDENLAGYERYRFFLAEERVRALLPGWLRTPLFGPMGWIYPKADRAPRVLRAKSTLESLARDFVGGCFHGVSIMTDAQRQALFSRSQQRALQGFRAVQVLRRHARSGPEDPLSLVQYIDFKTFLAGRVLTKVDRTSMAHGLEVRVPFLDHGLVAWLAGLPPEVKLRDGVGKHLLKAGLAGLLPGEILDRPKQGFSIPVAAWLRGPLRERTREAVLGERLSDTGLFRPRTLARLFEQHGSGQRDHSGPLWALLQFEAFLRRTAGA